MPLVRLSRPEPPEDRKPGTRLPYRLLASAAEPWGTAGETTLPHGLPAGACPKPGKATLPKPPTDQYCAESGPMARNATKTAPKSFMAPSDKAYHWLAQAAGRQPSRPDAAFPMTEHLQKQCGGPPGPRPTPSSA